MASVMFLRISFLVMMIMDYLVGPSQAFKYYVGGKDGWALKPSISFNHWSSQNRFQVQDSLIFKYKNGTDSVLQANQDDYNTCSTISPMLTLENNGDSSTFDLNHSGLFFFISGHSDNCNKGQKIIILVMAPRHASPIPAPYPTSFQGSPPDISPAASVPSPAASPLPRERSTSPGISPAASVPSEAGSPFPQGPSQASPPDDGKSASAPALGGDLVMLVLFWIVFN